MRQEPTIQTSPSTNRSHGARGVGILLYLLGSAPNVASADDAIFSENVARESGRLVSTLPPIGSNEEYLGGGSLGMSRGLGWYLSQRSVERTQKRLLFSAVKGNRYNEQSWNSATPGYDGSRFDESAVFPMVGANLGRSRDVSISGKGFAMSRKFHIGHSEYQWFFRKSLSAHKHLDRGPGGYMVGLGYNF